MQNPKTEKQEEIADTLISLGMSRPVANALACMHGTKEVVGRYFERAANLRQPEVSIAMRQLKERGWVDERSGNNIGRGRPHKIYSLTTPFKTIIAELEEQQRKREAEAQAKIERLKELARAA